jgi:23S rRNA pseudouridine2605 synthase
VYVAKVQGSPARETLRLLAAGIELEDGMTAPARARLVARDQIELTIHEGRKHQVKRMLEALGHPVLQLHRSRYAGLGLAGLEAGRWRELTAEEVASLKRESQ